MKLFFRYEFNVFLNVTKNGLNVGDKILTHLPPVTIVFSYYNFNYGLRLSRYIGSRHFSPEEQKPIYRPVALKGLRFLRTLNTRLMSHSIYMTKPFTLLSYIFLIICVGRHNL
jgi:hypothetical protein